MPQIVADAPGDRRFSSAVWREQPFFAWVKQSYLLYGEYLKAIAALATLPAAEKRRLEFSMRQFVDAIAPTNFPATNPDVLKRALETDGASVVAGLAQPCRRHRQGPDHDERRVGICARPQPRRHARQRRLPQRADRAAPVRRDDAEGGEAAAADRAAVHQQVLHPRPAAGELVRRATRSRRAIRCS